MSQGEAIKAQPETIVTHIPAGKISQFKNRELKHQQYVKLRKEKKKEKKQRRDARRKEEEALGDKAPPKQVPKTIESMREADETAVVTGNAPQEEQDEEVNWDIANDEFKDYFSKSYEPKILITSADNPHKVRSGMYICSQMGFSLNLFFLQRTIAFVKELTRIIPNATPFWRKRSSIKKIVKNAIANQYTDIMVVNEDDRRPNGLIVSHLPDGPTAHFKLSNVKITKDIRKDWREITDHRPEVILNNFTTRLGHTVARMMASLFHYEPQFRGKRAVTLHNQRDYIFFRHHRYEFKNAEKVRLRELGPRFTLRLRSLQKGTFDSKTGEYEWTKAGRRHELEESRRKFYL